MSKTKKEAKHNILLVLTGGTICSFANEQGEQESDVKMAEALIVKNFRNGDSKYRGEDCVKFHTKFPLNILSENMTIKHWNTLIGKMKRYKFSDYDGVIILHGTDTLAYTASLLSVLLAGINVPVFLVSSQLPVYKKDANGNANFKAAVELIVNGVKPNVYVVYRNEEASGKEQMYVHYASHLLQCANHSNNFYSCDMTPLDVDNPRFEGKSSGAGEMPLYTTPKLSPCVLRIAPYVGITYDRFSLRGVKAVIHGTYHSSTVCVNPYEAGHTRVSVMELKKRCDKYDIPLFIEPCDKDAYAYETTGHILRSGARAISGVTSEMAYVKALIGCANGLSGDDLERYINTQVNGEFI